MTILDELTGDYERADALVNLLIDRATGGGCDEAEYIALRAYFLNDPILATFVPAWLAGKRSTNQFWQFIKTRFSTYAERREFLWFEFERLLQYCERSEATPAEDEIEAALKSLSSENVERVWRKILYRLPEDPDGAITVARSLIEAVCKHILDELTVTYDEKADLPVLYRTVAKQLNLAPEQHDEQIFKQILAGQRRVCG